MQRTPKSKLGAGDGSGTVGDNGKKSHQIYSRNALQGKKGEGAIFGQVDTNHLKIVEISRLEKTTKII